MAIQAPKDWSVPVFLTLLVTLVVACFSHEIGQDEAQAWNVARAADGLWDVANQGRNEGHTPFWHGTLWFLKGFGSPNSMTWLSVLLVLVVSWRLLRDRPFGLLICALVLFSYFFVYEYSIVARPYVLALFFSALFASAIHNKHKHPLYLAVLLGLIAFTSAFGVALTAPFVVMLFVEWFTNGKQRPRSIPLMIGACFVYLTGVVLSVYYVIFPINENPYSAHVVSGNRINHSRWFETIETAFFPHFDRLPLGIGEWLSTGAAGQLLVQIAAIVCVLCLAVWLSNKPAALLGWLAGVFVLSAAAIISGSPSEKHLGHLFIAGLCLAWAAPGLTGRTNAEMANRAGFASIRGAAGVALGLVLVYQVLVGSGVVAFDISNKLTAGDEIASYISRNIDPPHRLITDNTHDIGHVLAHLGTDSFDQACQCTQMAADAAKARVWDPEDLFDQWCKLPPELEEHAALLSREAGLPEDDRFELVQSFTRGPRDHGALQAQYQLWVMTDEGRASCR